MKKQQGVAAIILVLILIPLFGCVFFALEGTRYIQKKTRLADASEAAAIAVTDQNPNQLDVNVLSDPNTTKITDSVLAKNYINSYVRNIKNEDISIQPSVTENYYQYNVNVNTEHQSWFNSTLIPSFKKIQSISESALARNDSALSNPRDIDLVLVADFSGSMRHNGKLETLKDAVNEISEKILANKSNRIAFVPFDMRTQELDNNKHHSCATSLAYKEHYKYKYDNNYNSYNNIDYNYKINDKYYFNYNENELKLLLKPKLIMKKNYCCLSNSNNKCISENLTSKIKFGLFGRKCEKIEPYSLYIYDGGYKIEYKDKYFRVPYTEDQKNINTILDVLDKSKNEIKTNRNEKFYINIMLDDYENMNFIIKGIIDISQNIIDRLSESEKAINYIKRKVGFYEKYPDPYEYIDIDKTIDIKTTEYREIKDYEYNNLFDRLLCKNNFYTLKLKHYSHYEFMDSINSMEYGGFTSIYQGILRGSQILKGEPGSKKNNRLKIMILLSDGDDAPFEKTFKTLADKGLCKNIEDYFKPNFHMGAIGIQYNAKKHSEILDCFGEKNVYQADNKALLINKINSIIQKGQKSSGITKLSDGQN
ncbi:MULTISPECIES: pilus assembly protein TadG-related protein [unclassified Photobacterium]|uniref:pilus assembly protein TadG-related protein n=1 Tax=unclassified Photobacterium TaxID=2628852 RepID=UPI001EDEE1D2|nr:MULTISPECIES: pilus assembly protein TadG-related protein [unclassified Photobacterium]MCG3865446.1 VWA domain-containing protein [Photobacterium sp. Ph6]MCG3876932.1 VWA domain-containing protein [Photobacterium sp. Ph5]